MHPPPSGRQNDQELAARILDSILAEPNLRHVQSEGVPGAEHPSPDLRAIEELLLIARTLVFPGFFDHGAVNAATLAEYVDRQTARLSAHLRDQVRIALAYACAGDAQHRPTRPDRSDEEAMWGHWRERMIRAGIVTAAEVDTQPDCTEVARRVAHRFLDRLPHVRALLALDVQAAFDGDPAAEHTDEIILCYPGLIAIMHHRLAHELYAMGVPLLPRIIGETAHRLTGIDIHPGARIGERFFVDHGAGTVIGETSIIGANVKIYQGVTLGAKSFEKDERGRLVRGAKRHPTIGDRVTIYAGAVILGGDTIIAEDCVVNGGVFLTMSVPPGHIVRQKQPELTMRSNPELRTRQH